MTSILSNFISPEKDEEHFGQIPLKRVLSREKEACEFYQERKALDEGDLPALIRGALRNVTTAMTPAETTSAGAVVTPSSNTSNNNNNTRSITPHRGNRQSEKKGKASSSNVGFKRGRKKEQEEADPIKKDLFGKVAVTSPKRLSPNSKRKHRVFWTQLDLDDVEDDDDTSNVKGAVMNTNDKFVKQRKSPPPTAMVATNVEVEEKNEPSMVDGILNAMNTCLDCGWMGSALTAGSNSNTIGTHSRALPSSDTQPPFFQNRAIVAGTDDDNSTDESDNDTQTMNSYSKVSRKVRGSNGYENTAIEVEFMNEDDVPDDEEHNNKKPSQGFVQLNTTGEVTQFVRKAASEDGVNQDHLQAYDLTKSQTWGEKEKSAYIQAMAKRAKDDFKRKKGIVDADSTANAVDSASHIALIKKPLKPALVRSNSMGELSPSKNVEFSPIGVTEFSLSRTDDNIIVPAVKRLNEGNQSQLSEAMALRPSGSILSLGRRKKKGDFQQLDDDDDGLDKENDYITSPPNLNLENTAKSLPHADVFDFKDVREDKAPMSSVKLDPYEDSCDVSLLGSLNVGGDGASVVSGKSFYTTGTHATNWSTSTRRRHRGAAKNRKVDLSDNQRPAGWLESIKAAAASNNRKWDPKHGWVDYIDQEEVEIQRLGKLKPLVNSKKNASTEKGDQNGAIHDKVSVPFPSEWEKDRDDMISIASHETETNTIVPVNEQKPFTAPNTQDVIQEASDEEEEREDHPKSLESSPIQRLKKKTNHTHIQSNVGHENATRLTDDMVETDFEGHELSRPSVLDWIGRCQSSDIVKDAAKGGGDIIKEAMPKFRVAISDVLNDQKTKLAPSVKVVDDIQDDDDFEGNNSFDFDNSGEEFNISNEDGFKVIESSKIKKFDDGIVKVRPITPNFEKEQESLNRLKSLKLPTELESDRSVVSTTSSVAGKAIDWRKKVEMKKVENGSKSLTIPENSTLFVSAVDDSSTFEVPKIRAVSGDDSIVKVQKMGAPKSYVRKEAEKAAPAFKISEYPKKTESQTECMSEVTTPSETSSFVPRVRNESFLSRLQACTGPMFESNDMPQAHLAFLKNSASGGSPIRSYRNTGFTNLPFCGNPDTVKEDTSSEVVESKINKPSVAASYLQALKEKSRSAAFIPKEYPMAKTSSDVSSGSGKSESWKRFLEKRNQALASSPKRSGSSVASEDPTSFAKKKVQEIINKISKEQNGQDNLAKNQRSSSTLPLRPPSIGVVPRSLSAGRQRVFMPQSDAAKAAEDLAAAKVEAMMLSQKFGKEGEI